MRALLAREFIVMARHRVLPIVLGVHVAGLLLFLLVWGRGVPTMPGASVYDQQQTVQLLALVALLPWVASRITISERSQGLAYCAVLLARRPSSIVVARVAASAAVLALVVASGLPAVMFALQMSALPLSSVGARIPELAGLCIVAAASAVGWRLVVGDRLWSWIGCTCTTALVVGMPYWWRAAAAGGASVVLMGGLLATVVAAGADRWCSHADA